MMYRKYIKGLIDRIAALVLSLLLLPVFIVVVLSLLITQGKDVFFSQMRSGKNLEEFRLYKFRTLVSTRSTDLSLNHRKYTILGKILRRTGVDELLQLINILNGNMSFIGPRPMPVEYREQYNKDQLNRFKIKPGITGWAQVNGRNDISWASRFELDNWYIKNVSFLLDVKIIWMTLIQVMHSMKTAGEKETEMQVFKGSNLT